MKSNVPRFALRIVFYAIFAGCFLVGGVVVLSGLMPGFRPGTVPAVALVLLGVFAWRLDGVMAAAGIFALAAWISALANGTDGLSLLVFLRLTLFAWVLHRLACLAVIDLGAGRVAGLMVALAWLQLPVAVAQTWLLDVLPSWRGAISALDVHFGTFCVKCDSQMGLYLCATAWMVAVGTSVGIGARAGRWRPGIALVLLVPVFVSNANMAQVAAGGLALWIVGRQLRTGVGWAVVLMAGVAAAGAWALGWLDGITALGKLEQEISALMSGDLGARAYWSGNYARGWGYHRLFEEAPSLWGAGPGSHYDPLAAFNARRVVDTYEYLYREVGLAGLGAALALLAALVLGGGGSPAARLVLFAVTLAMGTVVNLFSNPSMILALALASRVTANDPPQERAEPRPQPREIPRSPR